LLTDLRETVEADPPPPLAGLDAAA
jgi:hypothetical protein